MSYWWDFTRKGSWDKLRSAKEGEYFDKKNKSLIRKIVVDRLQSREESFPPDELAADVKIDW